VTDPSVPLTLPGPTDPAPPAPIETGKEEPDVIVVVPVVYPPAPPPPDAAPPPPPTTTYSTESGDGFNGDGAEKVPELVKV
jgi:hypothetical protein